MTEDAAVEIELDEREAARTIIQDTSSIAEYRDAPPGEPIGYEPSFEDVFARIAKATRTNAKLCGFVAKPAK